ncbi:hypothetical protein Pla175_31140 [Pirellulimonas nuda]|uniref:Uncharacterized protein n=1 Tax=Pirellulimonas nuda TaxID=2528009 RepID=A0A518DE25_9BACT|nr:hypothetical protein [Pirellulimonas nuda]QDU89719.1 hypothetical protein Pla175_31140 [Pirellulimonas nuda]
MSPDNNDAQPSDPERQADERLVHALLLHVYDERSAERREQSVQRAIRAIGGPSQPAGPIGLSEASRRPVRFPPAARGLTAAAAVVLAAFGFWTIAIGPSSAVASIDQIITALSRAGDRTYHIRMQVLPDRRGGPPPGARRPTQQPGLDDATLYLRGRGQYVLARRDPNGGMIFDGFDGRQSWRVGKGVVAETRRGLGAGGIPLPPLMAGAPFTDLPGTLEEIRTNYTLEREGLEPLPGAERPLTYVRARRNSRWIKGPETIEIWADPETAMPSRILFDDAQVPDVQGPCRITLDLVSEQPLASDWFGPAPHAEKAEPREAAPSSR